MSPKSQIRISSLCLAAMIIIVFAYGIIIFYIPALFGSYAETGQELPFMLKFARYISMLIGGDKNFLFIAPVLILGFVSALAWRIHSSIKAYQMNQLTTRSNRE
jgi:hypothetical protein